MCWQSKCAYRIVVAFHFLWTKLNGLPLQLHDCTVYMHILIEYYEFYILALMFIISRIKRSKCALEHIYVHILFWLLYPLQDLEREVS